MATSQHHKHSHSRHHLPGDDRLPERRPEQVSWALRIERFLGDSIIIERTKQESENKDTTNNRLSADNQQQQQQLKQESTPTYLAARWPGNLGQSGEHLQGISTNQTLRCRASLRMASMKRAAGASTKRPLKWRPLGELSFLSLAIVLGSIMLVTQLHCSALQTDQTPQLAGPEASSASEGAQKQLDLQVAAQKPAQKETLLATDTQPEPESVLAPSSASSGPQVGAQVGQASPATNESIIVQQQEEIPEQQVPSVSGLVSSDEQQQLATLAPSNSTDSPPNLEQSSGQQQQQVDTDQQLIAAVGGLQPEGNDDSVRLNQVGQTISDSNDVQSAGEQFGRKTIAASSPPTAEEQPNSGDFFASSQAQSGRANKGRSLKRAFGGHLGVFGRKRSQSAEEQQVVNEQPAAASKTSQGTGKKSSRENHHNYFYPIGAASVRQPAGVGAAAKGAKPLKSSDYPEYREILIQPDQAGERVSGGGSQLLEAQPQYETQTGASVDKQQESADNEQRVEQVHLQVGDTDFNEQLGQAQQQQQLDVTTPISEPQQQPAGGPIGEQVSEEIAGQVKQPEQPYIRLSNIATINQTSGQSGNSSSGEMKLMRIYVIDLDQKLVVGSNQPGAEQLGKSIQYALPQVSGPAAAATATTTLSPASSSEQYARENELGVASSNQAPAATSPSTPVRTFGERHDAQVINTNQQRPIVSDGYVLLDRNSLQANLSQLITQMNQQQQQQAQQVVANYTNEPAYLAAAQQAANYSAMPSSDAHQVSPGDHQVVYERQQQQPFQSQPVQLYPDQVNETSYGQPAYFGQPAIAQSSRYHYRFPLTSHNSTNSSSGLAGQVNGPQPYLIAAAYPAPVQVKAQQQQQQQQQVQQVHLQSVPQYIAPQYRQPTLGAANNLDGLEFEWQRQQQQQVRYNNNLSAPNNYITFVQAGQAARHQADYKQPEEDYKHQANSSYLSAYQPDALYQHQQQPSEAYSLQQQQQQPVQLTSEPAQAQYSSSSSSNNNNNNEQSKVSAGQWRPVDLSAPPVGRPANSISPAQYANTNRPIINGYKTADHEFVVGLSRANASHSQLLAPANDGQHATLNYHERPRKPSSFHASMGSANTSGSGEQFALDYPQQQQQQQVNDAPSQQELPNQHHLAHHPSSIYQTSPADSLRYNNGIAPAKQREEHSVLLLDNGAEYSQHKQTREHLTANGGDAPGYAQVQETNQQQQHQYGTNSLAAYGKPLANEQQFKLVPSNEAPRIPQAHSSANYRLTYKQPSAYLSVTGPPVSDGTYESAEADQAAPGAEPEAESEPEGQSPPAGHAGRARTTKQAQAGYRKRPRAPVRPSSGRYSSNNKPSELAAAEHQYQSAELGGQQHLIEMAAAHEEAYHRGAPSMGSGLYQSHYQQHARPLAGGSNFYRPSPGGYASGAKGLLSWETLSSVASGAAKRLPSLSSILSPFSGGSQMGGYHSGPKSIYSGANYAGGAPGPASQGHLKSAHYDRDVSAFHRPYPLRYASPVKHQQAQEAADYLADLSSSSSSAALSAETNSSHSLLGDQQQVEDAEAPTGEQVALSEQRPKLKGKRVISGRPTNASSTEVSAEPILGDLAEIEPSAIDSSTVLAGKINHKQQHRRPTDHRRPPKSSRPASKSESAHQSGKQIDAAVHAAVISSIEHELEANSAEGSKQASLRPQHRRPSKLKGSKAPLGAEHEAPLPGSEFVEPTIIGGQHSVPADQQHLLMGAKKPAPMFSGALTGDPAHLSELEQPDATGGRHLYAPDGSPIMEAERRPALSSVQIGQYRITPQTQFVHNIIEPSRQILGQYFKQYIGQLGQFAGR